MTHSYRVLLPLLLAACHPRPATPRGVEAELALQAVQRAWDAAATRPAAHDARSARVDGWDVVPEQRGGICDDYGQPSVVESDDPDASVSWHGGAWPGADWLPPSLLATCGVRADCYVQADPRSGVRLVDLADPDAPRLSPALPVRGRVMALHASAERALVVTVGAGVLGHDLAWYALDGATGPRLLAERHETATFVGTHRLPGAALRVAVLVEEHGEAFCSGRSDVQLRVLGGAPGEGFTHAFGRDAVKLSAHGALLRSEHFGLPGAPTRTALWRVAEHELTLQPDGLLPAPAARDPAPDALAAAGIDGSLLWSADLARARVLKSDTLQVVDLRDPAAPRVRASVPLFRTYVRATLVPGGVARVAWPVGAFLQPGVPEPLASLEFVDAAHDPASGPASTRLPVEGRASLWRVGELLVAVSQAMGVEQEQRRPCTLRVFDVPSPGAARQVAMLHDEAMCSAANSLTDQPASTLEHGVVFARREYRYSDPNTLTMQRYAFFWLDLREPMRPVLRGPYRMAEHEVGLSVYPEGDALQVAYRVDVRNGDPSRPEAHHYLRRVDFRGDEPRLGVPLSVPGEPWFIAGSTLLVRDARWASGGVERTLRRLSLGAGAAALVGSRAAYEGAGRAAAVLSDNSVLIVEARTMARQRVHLLTHDTLSERATLDVNAMVGPRVERRGNTLWLAFEEGRGARVSVSDDGKLRVLEESETLARRDADGARWLAGAMGGLHYLP